MSANLDLVRSIYADWERGDYTSVAWADPEIEWVQPDGPLPGTWMGLRGLAEVAHEWFDAWKDFRVEAKEYRELDDERVLVFVQASGRGKTSGLELGQIQADAAGVFHIRRGKVSRAVIYFDRDHAFSDLGHATEGDAA